MRRPYPTYKDSGAAWVGNVPEHWRVEKFRWVTNLSNHKYGDDNVERPMLSLSAYEGIKLKEYEYETQKRTEEQNSTYMVVKPKQLVVNPMWVMKRSIAVSELDLEGIVSPAYRVYDISEELHPRYFHYLMRSDIYVDEYNRHIRGLTTYDRSVRKDDFAELLVPIPPLEEQAAIVAFLEEQTAVINQFLTNKRRLIALLEEQKQVVINTAVTHGLDTAVPRKPSGIDWLSDTPVHWTEIKLSRVSKIFNGTTPSRNRPDYWEGNIPWISSGKVNDFVVRTASEYVTEKALTESSISLVPKGAVIIGMIGQGKTRGLSALLEIETCINQNLAAIVPNYRLDGKYLHYFLLASYEFIWEYGRGGNQEALNCQIISAFRVPLPPVSEQHEIVRHIEQKTAEINAAIERTQREIELIEEYRTTLIAHAVTGKIDVRFKQGNG